MHRFSDYILIKPIYKQGFNLLTYMRRHNEIYTGDLIKHLEHIELHYMHDDVEIIEQLNVGDFINVMYKNFNHHSIISQTSLETLIFMNTLNIKNEVIAVDPICRIYSNRTYTLTDILKNVISKPLTTVKLYSEILKRKVNEYIEGYIDSDELLKYESTENFIYAISQYSKGVINV